MNFFIMLVVSLIFNFTFNEVTGLNMRDGMWWLTAAPISFLIGVFFTK